MSAATARIADEPAGGWLRHDGWEYRGTPEHVVEIRFRNGMTPRNDPSPAGNWRWMQWKGGKHDFDIVEYRKVPA